MRATVKDLTPSIRLANILQVALRVGNQGLDLYHVRLAASPER
jgi:hypothetical protein